MDLRGCQVKIVGFRVCDEGLLHGHAGTYSAKSVLECSDLSGKPNRNNSNAEESQQGRRIDHSPCLLFFAAQRS